MDSPGTWELRCSSRFRCCWNDDERATTELSCSVTVTGAEVVNKDSVAEVVVGGLPLEGGVLTVG